MSYIPDNHIKLSYRYSISSDPYNWILHEWYQYEGKQGTKNEGLMLWKSKESYFPNFEKMANSILDREIKTAMSLESLLSGLHSAQSLLAKLLEEVVDSNKPS